ncbi:hypothetical protein N9S06_02875 [Gammaproteobacteria bacterium]|nr:hypothetical protein [Gammaproteobacteria bacterium]
MAEYFLVDTFIEILIKLILSPYVAFTVLFPFIFISYAIELSEETLIKRDIFLNRILILTTSLVFIFSVTYEETLYDNLFKSINDEYITVQQFLELLVSNYKLGTLTVVICLFYTSIIPVESPRSNRYTNTIYMFIFLYTFCFLVLSGIPVNAGLEYLESSGLMNYGGPTALLIQVVLGFGPYLIYGITLLIVLFNWFGCLVRIIYPNNRSIL